MKLKKISIVLLLSLVAVLLAACTAPLTGGFPLATVSQDTLFASVGPAVVALKADGTQLWRYPDKVDANKTFFGAPLVTSSQVIVGDYQNSLFALDPSSGVEKWNFPDAKGRYIASPVVAGDRIIAANADGNVYALDLTGKQVWKFSGKAGFWSTPLVDNNLIYAASMDHMLYALKASDGTQLWAADLGASALANPVLSKGVIYIGTLGSQLVSVNAGNGEVSNRYDTKGAVWAAPVIKDNLVYVGDLSNTIYALRIEGLQLDWSGDAPGPILAAPGVTPDGMLFVCETGEILMVGFKNERSWTDKVANGKLYSSPVVLGDRLIVPVQQGDPILLTYDFSGRKGWTLPVPK
jgi:outer membrane protein assembly factor BamB